MCAGYDNGVRGNSSALIACVCINGATLLLFGHGGVYTVLKAL